MTKTLVVIEAGKAISIIARVTGAVKGANSVCARSRAIADGGIQALINVGAIDTIARKSGGAIAVKSEVVIRAGGVRAAVVDSWVTAGINTNATGLGDAIIANTNVASDGVVADGIRDVTNGRIQVALINICKTKWASPLRTRAPQRKRQRY